MIGGITVLTDLNPWIVSFHLLLSLAMVGRVRWCSCARIDHPAARCAPPARSCALAWATFAAAWVVLYVGTVVTGSGPHAGDASSPRNGLDPLQLSQLHADLVFLLVGLTVGLLRRAARAGAPARRRTAVAGAARRSSCPGRDRLRAVLHRPAGRCWSASTCSAPALISASVTWTLVRVREPA